VWWPDARAGARRRASGIVVIIQPAEPDQRPEVVMLDHLRMKWQIFVYNYQWPDYIPLFDGWIAKCSMAVPIVGYLILFNDSISQHIAFNRLASEQLISFGISSGARLKFLYFGLLALGASNLLYRIRRPYALKIGKNQFEYVETALSTTVAFFA
jgi:hypothetical protein